MEAVRNGEEGADEKEPRHPEARRWLANFGVHALGVENKPPNKRGRAHARSARRAAGPALAGGMPDCLHHLLKPLVRLLPPLKLNPSDPRPQD